MYLEMKKKNESGNYPSGNYHLPLWEQRTKIVVKSDGAERFGVSVQVGDPSSISWPDFIVGNILETLIEMISIYFFVSLITDQDSLHFVINDEDGFLVKLVINILFHLHGDHH